MLEAAIIYRPKPGEFIATSITNAVEVARKNYSSPVILIHNARACIVSERGSSWRTEVRSTDNIYEQWLVREKE